MHEMISDMSYQARFTWNVNVCAVKKRKNIVLIPNGMLQKDGGKKKRASHGFSLSPLAGADWVAECPGPSGAALSLLVETVPRDQRAFFTCDQSAWITKFPSLSDTTLQSRPHIEINDCVVLHRARSS